MGVCGAAAGDDAACSLAAAVTRCSGNSATAATATTTNARAAVSAPGVRINKPRSFAARFGRLVMGYLVETPDTMNRPITATYVPTHNTQTTLRMKYDAYARYNTAASPSVDIAKM